MIDLPEFSISLSQPWAYAVLFLGKDIENRSWSTRYRGPITLHAAKSWDRSGEIWLATRGLCVPLNLPRGAYVGTATIVDCWEVTGDEDPSFERPFWAFGPWCFVLKDVSALATPIPSRGQLGIYRRPELKVKP